jgi:acyl dehydratase
MSLDYERLLSARIPDREQTYTERDTIIYALAVGVGAEPLDERQLDFVYEKKLHVLPTFASTLAWKRFAEIDIGLTYAKMVHGEQRMVMHRPVPPSGSVVSKMRVADVVDRGAEKGAVVYFERQLFDQTNQELISTQTLTIFARADGGFGGPERPILPSHSLPDRAPDIVQDIVVSPRAALLYRLCGDLNPLHIDPVVARKAGFDRPILHGLATYGYCGRLVLDVVCGGDPDRLTGLEGRFSAPVYPGETIRGEIWVDGDVASLRVKAVERDAVIFNNGRAVVKPA